MGLLNKGRRGSSLKLGFLLIGLAFCILTIFAIIKFGTILFFLPIWSWLANTLSDNTGLNIWLAKGTAAILIILLFYFCTKVISWQKEKRANSVLFLGLLTALICASMFFITKDANFSFKDGKAQKWYSIDPKTHLFKIFFEPGFDTETGDSLQAVTREIVPLIKAQKKHKKEIAGTTETVAENPLVLEETPLESEDLVLYENSILSPDDAQTLVNKIKNMVNDYRFYVQDENSQLSFFTSLFEYLQTLKSGSECSPLLCQILQNKFNEWSAFDYFYVKEMINYIRAENTSYSLPTLMYVYTKAADPAVRACAIEAYRAIKNKDRFYNFMTAESTKKTSLVLSVFFIIGLCIYGFIRR
jgi:hypothetical protein